MRTKVLRSWRAAEDAVESPKDSRCYQKEAYTEDDQTTSRALWFVCRENRHEEGAWMCSDLELSRFQPCVPKIPELFNAREVIRQIVKTTACRTPWFVLVGFGALHETGI